MRQYIKTIAGTLSEMISNRVSDRIVNSKTFANGIAYQLALETKAGDWVGRKTPHELFAGITEEFWFWLNTQGYRSSQLLRSILPATPEDDVQLSFTGNKGDPVLREGFNAYTLFKELYEANVGSLADCTGILDFGCGWGRIIRFFLRDVDPSRLYGCDPVGEMIELCKRQNKWCNFRKIETSPPTSFDESMFDLIYGYSVFSHLSEDKHASLLSELHRILKPGGLLIMTTRSRDFIGQCADMRNRGDLQTIHPGPRSSASAFMDTQESLGIYDRGDYCFSSLSHEWSYWGEAAISKSYVLKHWTSDFDFVDYVNDSSRCEQSVIVVKKPAIASSDKAGAIV